MVKVLFIGVGSIAGRHIRNLTAIFQKRGEDICIDVARSGKGKPLDAGIAALIRNEYQVRDGKAGDMIPGDYDIAFVTNPTALHFNTMKEYVSKAKHMFIEKPVFDSYNYDIGSLHLKKDSICYVACPLRYTSVLQYVKANFDCSKAIAVRSISSSYLPDWRPGTDYRNTYSAHRAMGGGVDIDLIHEWDYLTWLFGLPDKVYLVMGKFSDLQIDSDDSALYVAANDQMTFELHLDYYGRKTIRQMQIFMPDATIDVDLLNLRIWIQVQGEEDRVIELPEDRNVYQIRELEHFLDIIEGKCANDNDVWHAVQVLKLTGREVQR